MILEDIQNCQQQILTDRNGCFSWREGHIRIDLKLLASKKMIGKNQF